MCNQLHVTWMKVEDMKNMIMKGWDKKLLIIRTFKFNFQLVALQANAITLFTVIQGIEKQMEKDLNVDPTLPFINHYQKMFGTNFYFNSSINYRYEHMEILNAKTSQEASYHMKLEHEAKVGIWDGKCIFPYTHANKPQQFNCKTNVILINFEKNMRMNVSIHPHYG